MAITLLRECASVEKSISLTIMDNEDLHMYRCDLSKNHSSEDSSGSQEYKNPETTLTYGEDAKIGHKEKEKESNVCQLIDDLLFSFTSQSQILSPFLVVYFLSYTLIASKTSNHHNLWLLD